MNTRTDIFKDINALVADASYCEMLSDIDSIHISSFDDYKQIAIPYIDSLYGSYSTICKTFDETDSTLCFDKSFAFDREATEVDNRQLLIAIKLLFKATLSQPDASLSKAIRRDVLRLVSRYLMVYSTIADKEMLNQISCSTLRILTYFYWEFGELVLVRLLMLNLFDRASISDKAVIMDMLSAENNPLRVDEASRRLLIESLDKYLLHISRTDKVDTLEGELSYAIIYKKRFGFLHCTKILSKGGRDKLPFSLVAVSPAFLNFSGKLSQSSSRVIMFEKGTIKRNSEYKKPESNGFYNLVTQRFE